MLQRTKTNIDHFAPRANIARDRILGSYDLRRQISAISPAVEISKWVCSISFKASSCNSLLREPTQSFNTTMS